MVTTPTIIQQPPLPAAADDPAIDYPSEYGERLAETDFQYVPLTDTVSALRNRYRRRHDVYPAGNMLVYYRVNDTTVRVAPDVYVAFGVNGNHKRYSWFVWREGKAPDFVLEVASRSTRARDRMEKRDIYARMGVTEYWRFDPHGGRYTPALAGERLVDGAYRPITVVRDAGGILRGYSELLGLDLCVPEDMELRLYDPVADEWLRTHQDSEAALQAEATARQEAEAALRASEQENERLRELLRRLQEQQ